MRRVTRTYWSKRRNVFVTKVYEYKNTSRRSKVLVTKTGKIYQKNLEEFEEQIRNSDKTENQKRTLISSLRALVNQRHNSKTRLTVNGFLGKQRRDAPSRFLTNAGYSAEEFAEETGLNERDILNVDNWRDGMLIVGQRRFRFNWTYTGAFYEEI